MLKTRGGHFLSKMFYDLNIRRPETQEIFSRILSTLLSLGYDVIAITTEVTDENFTAESGKKGKQNRKNSSSEVRIPPPFDVSMYKNCKMKILNRINITVTLPASFHKISQSKQIKLYDLISYLPGNAAVLKTLTGVLDFDILSYNPAIDHPPLYYNRKLYNQFIQNGVYMELPYAPAILDSSCRKYCIFTASVYHAVGKSENIIVTSAGSDCHHFRSPYDVISLCVLYGLSEEQAKNSITRKCDSLLLRARTRHRGRSTVEMTLERPIIGVQLVQQEQAMDTTN